MENFILLVDKWFEWSAQVWSVISSSWLLLIPWVLFIVISLLSLILGLFVKKGD